MKKMMVGLENPTDRLQHGIDIPKLDSAEEILAWLENNLPIEDYLISTEK